MDAVAGRRDEDFAPLVRGALDGEQAAWDALVTQLQNVAWRTISGFDLGAEDRQDAFASTFFRLFEHLASIREPAKLPGWIATTARNEVLTLLRSRRRDLPAVLRDEHLPAVEIDPAGRLLDDELHRALRDGLSRLDAPCRQLLQVLTVEPPLSYAEVGALLDLPHGSIGPTRQRCLDRLRSTPELRPYLQEVR